MRKRKRKRPSWEEYFLGIALVVARRSHDVHTQHGCVLVDELNHIVGVGYNGYPRGMDDDLLPKRRPQKYQWMIHAEVNAVSNCHKKPIGCTAYITGPTCNPCLMHLWQNGVERIVQLEAHGCFNKKWYGVKQRKLLLKRIKIDVVDADLRWLKDIVI